MFLDGTITLTIVLIIDPGFINAFSGASRNAKMQNFYSVAISWLPFIIIYYKHCKSSWKIESEATLFCKIDPLLASDKSVERYVKC